MTSRLQDSEYVGCIQNELVMELELSQSNCVVFLFFIVCISLIQEAMLGSVYNDELINSWLFQSNMWTFLCTN